MFLTFYRYFLDLYQEKLGGGTKYIGNCLEMWIIFICGQGEALLRQQGGMPAREASAEDLQGIGWRGTGFRPNTYRASGKHLLGIGGKPQPPVGTRCGASAQRHCKPLRTQWGGGNVTFGCLADTVGWGGELPWDGWRTRHGASLQGSVAFGRRHVDVWLMPCRCLADAL